jgi:hypothetical protein
MQTVFKKATRHLAPEDIVTGAFPPFGSFTPASFLSRFYRHLSDYQAGQNAPVEGGFVYGGVFADIAKGRTPRDYDIYIAAPGMVDAMRRYLQEDNAGYDLNEGEWAAHTFGYDFPVSPLGEVFRLNHADMFGDYFEFNGIYEGEDGFLADLKIGSRLPSLPEFLSHCDAPVMAAAMMLGDEPPQFAYHRDFADHTNRNLLCIDRPEHPVLIEKARRKGMTIITPEQAAETTRHTVTPGLSSAPVNVP